MSMCMIQMGKRLLTLVKNLPSSLTTWILLTVSCAFSLVNCAIFSSVASSKNQQNRANIILSTDVLDPRRKTSEPRNCRRCSRNAGDGCPSPRCVDGGRKGFSRTSFTPSGSSALLVDNGSSAFSGYTMAFIGCLFVSLFRFSVLACNNLC